MYINTFVRSCNKMPVVLHHFQQGICHSKSNFKASEECLKKLEHGTLMDRITLNIKTVNC